MKTPLVPPAFDPVALRIVSEARKEFFSLGFSQVTMDDLAEKMGMSKKTLYKYFPGKEELLRAVLLYKLENAERDLLAITDRPTSNLKAQLSEAISCLLQHMGEVQPPFVRDMRRNAPEFFQFVEARRRDMIDRSIGKVIREGMRVGEMRSDLSPELAMEILLGMVNSLVNPIKISELGIPPVKVLSAVFTVFFEGLLIKKRKSK